MRRCERSREQTPHSSVNSVNGPVRRASMASLLSMERTMNRLRCVLFLAGALLGLPLRAAEPVALQPTSDGAPVAIRAAFTADGSGAGPLSVQATLAEGWPVYSLTE